jgi:hypothetical protein
VSAGGATARSKNYTALAFSSSVVASSSGDATSKAGSQNKALGHCQNIASGYPDLYRGDCQGAGWVKNGWIAVAREGTLEGPAYDPKWSWGYGATREEANYWALEYCFQDAAEPCVVDRVERTRNFNPAKPTRGGGW